LQQQHPTIQEEDGQDSDAGQQQQQLPGIGVFGTGVTTRLLVPHLRSTGFRIAAVWGKTLKEADRCAAHLSIPFATHRIDDVLLCKEVDLILVLSPPSLHSQITVKALGIGKHVAVESPAGISQSETLRKVKAALYYPSLISIVVYGLRFLPAFARLRAALLEEDLIGPVTLCDVQVSAPRLVSDADPYSWACDGHMGGGVLNQFGSHVVDVLAYAAGLKAARVHGSVRTLTKTTPKINGIRQISADDFACFQMEGRGPQGVENFTTVTLNGASNSAHFQQRLLFHGEKGELIIDQDGNLIHRRLQQQLAKPHHQNGSLVDSTEEEVVLCHGGVTSSEDINTSDHCPRLPRIYEEGVARLFRHLAEEMAGRKNCRSEAENCGGEKQPSFANFDDALYVQAVIEAVRCSSKNKAWTKVSLAQW